MYGKEAEIADNAMVDSQNLGKGKWLPLKMAGVALIIAMLGGAVFFYHRNIIAYYRMDRVHEALLDDSNNAFVRNVDLLLDMPEHSVIGALRSARFWPQERREAFVRRIFNQRRKQFEGWASWGQGGRDCLPLLEALEAVDPNNVDVLGCKADYFYYMKNNYIVAVGLYDKAVRLLEEKKWVSLIQPKDIYGKLTDSLMETEDYRELENVCRVVLARHEDLDEEGYGRLLAIALGKQGRYFEAICHIADSMKKYMANGKTLEQNGDALRSLYALRAELLFCLGRKDLAFKDVAKYHSLIGKSEVKVKKNYYDQDDEGSPDVDYQLRVYCGLLGKVGKDDLAVRILRKRIADNRESLTLRIALASAYEKAGDSAAAQEQYKRAAIIDPADGTVQNNMAWLCCTAADRSVRDPLRALHHAERALRFYPSKPAFMLDTLAEANYLNRNFEKAVKYETLAVDKSGKRYSKPLVRYCKALDEQRSGKVPVLTEYPDKDELNYPPSTDKESFDPKKIPGGMRCSLADISAFLPNSPAPAPQPPGMLFHPFYSDVSLCLMANKCVTVKAGGIDDQRSDLRLIFRALAKDCVANNGNKFSKRAVVFYSALHDVIAGKLTDEGGILKSDPPESLFALRFWDIISGLNREQAGRLLNAFSSGYCYASHFYDSDYYDNRKGESESVIDREKVWREIRVRLDSITKK